MKCVFFVQKVNVVVLALLFASSMFFVYMYQQIGDRTDWAKKHPLIYKISTGNVQAKHLIRTNQTNATSGQRPPLSLKYYKHWDVNCLGIFAGNEEVIASMGKEIRQEQKKGSLMPSDSTVVTWTGDCALYKKHRGYPMQPYSKEEASFPLAYILVIHKDSAQVERLLRAIYQPQNIYCLHPDSNSPREFLQAMAGLAKCFDNVFIASKVEDVVYPGFTLLMSNINCMKDLTGRPASGYLWRYVMNLCGQDFPLKTNLEIVRQLKAYNGHNGIESFVPTNLKKNRTLFKVLEQNGGVFLTTSKNSPAPHGLKVYTGWGYYAVTRDFVDHILRDPVSRDLLNWTGNTYMPDETYWATLQRAPGIPGGIPIANEQTQPYIIRYGNWLPSRLHPCRGRYVRALCIFTIADLQYVQKQPHLFANKFYYQDDPVSLQCLETSLDLRVRHPEESTKLAGFLPVQYLD